MSAAEEYKWLVGLVQERYASLGLSYEQAERVHAFEQDKSIYSDKHYFTPWEEWDYELSSFRDILTADQLTVYERDQQAIIRGFEQSLLEQDAQMDTDIAFHEAAIQFYRTQLLPGLLGPAIPMFVGLRQDKDKVHYLKKEYQVCLLEAKKGILVNHFRDNRTFRPKELQAALLRHQLWCLLPDYGFFLHRMDAPTKAVAEYVERKAVILLEDARQLIIRKFSELRAFSEANYRQHYGSRTGWHMVQQGADEQTEMLHCAMSVLLLEGKRGEL